MKSVVFSILFALLSLSAYGQIDSTATTRNGLTIGIEAETVIYLIGGYHVSIWLGHKQFRHRLVYVNGEINLGLDACLYLSNLRR